MNSFASSRLSLLTESLEARRLLAVTYSAVDYFPLTAGQTWTYSATVDNSSATVSRALANTTMANTSVVRMRDSATVSGQSFILDRFFRHDGSKGLKLYGLDAVDHNRFIASVRQTTALPILPATFSTGTVSSWKNLSVASTITVPSLDNTAHGVTGLDTGSVTVVTASNETHGGYLLISPIKMTLAHAQSYTTTVDGQSFAITLTITESWMLSKGIGMISGNTSLNLKVKGGYDVDYNQSITAINSLTTSSLLTGFTKVTSGALRVGGTSGDDTIAAGINGSSILVVRNNVGVNILNSGLTRIVIDASDGNDTIGPLNTGTAMRSSLIGGKGNDIVAGGAGRDLIYGGDGNDILSGGSGRDSLYGESGNDTLNGNNAADIIDGGLGTDTAKTDSTDTRIAIEVLL